MNMKEREDKPIAICRANEVEVYEFPFFLKPENDLEPLFLFLGIHLENFGPEDDYILKNIIRIDSAEDLEKLGFSPAEDGIFYL